ncbi:MAG: TlpA family protein disulfide reductase [Lachnospiraceae bacterium]|nr:TlpA family protein disulfide reductase [Lachnospiraceae bacterium]
MRQKNKLLRVTSMFLITVLLTAGCGKASVNDTDKAKSPESAVSVSEGNTEEAEKSGSNAGTGIPSQMPSFTAKDLDGNTVTEDIFGEKDLTVVNIWGTFCPPCIAEMPELGEWADAMPDNVQIVGLIIDISGDEDTKHHDLAVTITETAGVKYTNIIANTDFNDILKWVVGVPTTLFVDQNGAIVGEPIVGANVEGYKTFVEEYLDEQ